MPFPSKRLTNSERIFIQKYSIKLRKEKDSFISHAHRDRLQILERAFSFISKVIQNSSAQKWCRRKRKEGKVHAVITIEAALSIPLFFLAGVTLIYLLEVQATRISVKMGAYSAAKNAAERIYLAPVLLPSKIESDIAEAIGQERLNQSIIVGKSGGIDCRKSRVRPGSGIIEIVVEYKVQPPVKLFGVPPVPQGERLKIKGWNGYQRGSYAEKEGYVYITETGTVYHKSYQCTHLKLSIQAGTVSDIGDLRNEYQGKYYPCEKCKAQSASGMIYYTKSGDRYHASLGCSGLKRNIRAVRLSEVGGRGACSRCGRSKQSASFYF